VSATAPSWTWDREGSGLYLAAAFESDRVCLKVSRGGGSSALRSVQCVSIPSPFCAALRVACGGWHDRPVAPSRRIARVCVNMRLLYATRFLQVRASEPFGRTILGDHPHVNSFVAVVGASSSLRSDSATASSAATWPIRAADDSFPRGRAAAAAAESCISRARFGLNFLRCHSPPFPGADSCEVWE
jgi:hypothetical protein